MSRYVNRSRRNKILNIADYDCGTGASRSIRTPIFSLREISIIINNLYFLFRQKHKSSIGTKMLKIWLGINVQKIVHLFNKRSNSK